MHLFGSPFANQGFLAVTNVIDLLFSNLEVVSALANVGDGDKLTFHGTDRPNDFLIHLGAKGTIADPVMRFRTPGGATLLTLSNYNDFPQGLNVLGAGSGDVFNVHVSDNGVLPGRKLFIDGGSPSDVSEEGDQLNVTFAQPEPAIAHAVVDTDPDAGNIDVLFAMRHHVIGYDDIEGITLQPL